MSGSDVEVLLDRLPAYPPSYNEQAKALETLRALSEAILSVEDTTDRVRLAGRQLICARLAEVMPYVDSDEDDERAAGQRVLISLWPAGTGAAAGCCAPHVDVIMQSLGWEHLAHTAGPEVVLGDWIEFVIGALGSRPLVDALGVPSPDGLKLHYVWQSYCILRHMGASKYQEHAGKLIDFLVAPGKTFDDYDESHDLVSMLLAKLDADVLASHADALMAGVVTAPPWVAQEKLADVIKEIQPDVQKTRCLPAILTMFHHADPEVRANAVSVLGELNKELCLTPEVAAALATLLEEPISEVRTAVLFVLSWKFDAQVLATHAPAIAMLLEDPDVDVVDAALYALADLKPRDLETYAPAVASLLEHHESTLQSTAGMALSHLEPHVLEVYLPRILARIQPDESPKENRHWKSRALTCMQKLEPRALEAHVEFISDCCQDQDLHSDTISSALNCFEKLPPLLQFQFVGAIEAIGQMRDSVCDTFQKKHASNPAQYPAERLGGFTKCCEHAEKIMERLYAPGGPGFLQAQDDFHSRAQGT
jgi:HEAT repeat protein